MGSSPRGSPTVAVCDGRSRGQSSVVGLVIVIGITLVGISGIMAFGTSVLYDSQASTEVERAGQAMSKLDSKISFTGLGTSDQQSVYLPQARSDSTMTLDEDAGWMNVSIRNSTNNTVRTRILNETMGSIVYENTNQDVKIAYQGGGVWRKQANGAVMVSPPEFHYKTRGGDPTLTLPLVVLDGSGTINGDIRVSKNGTTVSKYPVLGAANKSNPLTEGEVNITISSEYYEAWGDFFEDRTDGNVTYDHDRNVAMVSLVIPQDDDEKLITRAISSTATGEDMELKGSGSSPAFVDSYNSTDGPYTTSQSDNGTIEVAGDVSMSGNAQVKGDLESGGYVDLSGTSTLDGMAYWTTGFSAGGSTSYDGEEQISGVETAGSSTNTVVDKLNDLEDSNDNGFADDISGETLDFSGGEASLNASGGGSDGREYYLKTDTTISGDKLILNTTDGPVTLGVDGDLTLEKDGDGANITVVGDNRAEIWVRDDVNVLKDSKVFVPDDKAERMWLYATGESDIAIEGSNSNPANFTGVVYAPRSSGEDGDTTVKHGNVWGAMVVGQITVDAYGDVHYDQALADDRAFNSSTSGTTVPQITYLHVSVNRVTVTDS